MKGELLELIPQKYLCPKCGKWHKYTWDQNLGYYDSSDYAIEMHCPNSFGIIEVYFANDRCYWNEGDQCYWCKISEFSEIGESRVQMIDSKNNFRLGFEFKPEEYAQVYAAEILEEANRKEEALNEREKELTLREKKLEENETALQAKEIALQTKVAKKEEANVMSKVTSFKKQIYEHSPKENVELIKEFLEKYKGTLKWLVPVVSIYGAYGVVSGAYALTRVFDSTDKPEELSVEEIEGKMDSVEEAHQKFAWIQPKAEKLMPVAASVLVVYVLTQKPQWYEKVKDKVVAITGDASAKAGVYIEMAKLFIASKLNIDLDDEAQAKKFKTFALLAAIIGLCAFLYGKGVFNTEEDQSFMEKNPQLKAFIEQAKEIMEKILPTAFSAVTTYMVTKHIIDANDEESNLEAEKKNAVDTDFNEVKEETAE